MNDATAKTSADVSRRACSAACKQPKHQLAIVYNFVGIS